MCGLLAENDRLRTYAAVVLGAGTIDEIVELGGVSAVQVGKAMRKLTRGGLVTSDENGRFTAGPQVFKDAVMAADARDRPEPLDSDPERDALLQAVFRHGRLRHLPSSTSKQIVVLEHLVTDFSFDRRYPESEVNALLKERYDDHATLRRYLVDHGLLARAAGVYWRPEP